MVGTRKTQNNNLFCVPVDAPLPMTFRKIMYNGAGCRHQASPLTLLTEVKDLSQHAVHREHIGEKNFKLLHQNQGHAKSESGTILFSKTKSPGSTEHYKHRNVIVNSTSLKQMIKKS